MKLTIGMAHHDDFHGAYFTIQDIVKELRYNGRSDLLREIEFLVVDNNPESSHGRELKTFITNNVPNGRYVDYSESVGTSSSRNKVVEEASGEFVLVMDCHVLLCPTNKVLIKLFNFLHENPDTRDLYSGPLVYDNIQNISTHYNSRWGCEMWGQWGCTFSCSCGELFSVLKDDNTDNNQYVTMVEQKPIKKCIKCNTTLPVISFYGHEAALPKLGYRQVGFRDESPFEIFAQGLGLFLTKKDAWMGFNPHARGFGGEEVYIHTKYRQDGRKAICLPFLKWLHRFTRPDGVTYPLTLENKARNYILEFTELGLDLQPIHENFKRLQPQVINSFIEEAKNIYHS
jgi:glycosyltransferase involved in cell wall biosynthesis